MAAANTDKLRKKESVFSTTLSGSITDSDTTIGLTSVTGLATDTAITLTIDRVDADGEATPSAVERVTGVVSGSNLTNCLRAQDGTSASAHSAGAVVEDIWDSATWNDALDAILAEHTQAGVHDPTTLSGWGYIAGDDSTLVGETVAFGDTFDDFPVVIVSSLGRTTSTPADIGDLDLEAADVNVATQDVTTTNFFVNLREVTGGTLSSSSNYGYAWVAIGTLA